MDWFIVVFSNRLTVCILYVCACVRACVHASVHARVCVCVCVCVCIFTLSTTFVWILLPFTWPKLEDWYVTILYTLRYHLFILFILRKTRSPFAIQLFWLLIWQEMWLNIMSVACMRQTYWQTLPHHLETLNTFWKGRLDYAVRMLRRSIRCSSSPCSTLDFALKLNGKRSTAGAPAVFRQSIQTV